jgi:hypothetical protein
MKATPFVQPDSTSPNLRRLFPLIGSRRSRDRVVIEMPSDVAIGKILPDLLKVLEWKEFPAGTAVAFESEEGVVLPDQLTLDALGVTSSDFLYIAEKQKPDLPPSQGNNSPLTVPEGDIVALEPCSPHLNDWDMLPQLIGPDGLRFVLDAPCLVVGRKTKGMNPDLDVSKWDTKMVVSRKHAIVEKMSDFLQITPEKTTNGTFVNNEEITAGQSHRLQDGDSIQFGFQGPVFIFHQQGF